MGSSSPSPRRRCSLVLSDVDHNAFQKSFFVRTGAEKIDEEREGRTIAQVYILFTRGRDQLVHLNLAPDAGADALFVATSIASD
jgi:hypothetical protein